MTDTCEWIGKTLDGFCNGFFGRDSYGKKVIEAMGKDWVVVREEGIPKIATFVSQEDMLFLLEEWVFEDGDIRW